jgi:hypothetical protein
LKNESQKNQNTEKKRKREKTQEREGKNQQAKNNDKIKEITERKGETTQFVEVITRSSKSCSGDVSGKKRWRENEEERREREGGGQWRRSLNPS